MRWKRLIGGKMSHPQLHAVTSWGRNPRTVDRLDDKYDSREWRPSVEIRQHGHQRVRATVRTYLSTTSIDDLKDGGPEQPLPEEAKHTDFKNVP